MKKKIGLIVSGLLIIIFATGMAFAQVGDYWKASHFYRNAAEQYVSVSKDIVEKNNDENNWDKIVDVDISSLRNINEDIIGWIYFENVDISYPVLYSGDNSTYLRCSYTGEDIQAGSIFMEANNSRDFSDAHTIIYGHNMKDLSMFGKLKYYASDEDYILSREYFQIITDQRKYRYKIISYKTVTPDSDVYTIYGQGDQDFPAFVNNVLQKGSHLESNYSIECNDHLITLSTCAGDNRFVVTAVRCGEIF